MQLGPKVILSIGGIPITETVCWSVIISILIIIFAFIATRKMEKVPKGAQLVGELLVNFVYGMVEGVMGKKRGEKFAPYIGTLITFLAIGSCLGLFELRPITADLNTTIPLALVSFILIHYNSIKSLGMKRYLKEKTEPYAFITPMTILDEIIFPVTLGMRIFGNILAGVIVMTLLYSGLETLSAAVGSSIPFFQIGIPLPIHAFFDMFEPGLQAYIFCMLTIVFISNNMKEEEDHL